MGAADPGDRDPAGSRDLRQIVPAFRAAREDIHAALGGERAAAEEIARQTMLSVWRKAGEFKPGTAGAAAWIFTIARNLRIDALRRARRGGAAEIESDNDGAEPQIDERLTPESQVAAGQLEHCAREAMARLSNEQLRAIERSFFEDKPEGEIAALLGPRLRSLLGHTS